MSEDIAQMDLDTLREMMLKIGRQQDDYERRIFTDAHTAKTYFWDEMTTDERAVMKRQLLRMGLAKKVGG